MIRIDDIDIDSELMEMIEYVKNRFNLKWQDLLGIDMAYDSEKDKKFDRIEIYYWRSKKNHYLWRTQFFRKDWDEFKLTGKDFLGDEPTVKNWRQD